MSTSQKLGRGLASALFKFALLVIPVLLAINFVFGKPDTIKKVLKDSNIYSSFSDGIVEQAKQDNKEATPGVAAAPANAVKDIIIQGAIKATLTPEFTQSTAEQVIDGTYSWLDGTTEKPNFNIDLTPLKTNLANAVGDGGVAHFQTLPVCTQTQMRQIDPNTVDPLTLPCLPPGINLQAERQKLVNEALANNEVVEDPSLNADTIKAEGESQSPFEQASYIPTIFQWSKVLPWILGVAGLAAAAGVVLLEEDRRRGIKSLSRTLIVVGVLLLVSVLISKFFANRIPVGDELAKSASLQASVVFIIKALSSAFNRVLLIFAIIYAVIGGGGLAWLKYGKPVNS